MKRTLVVMPYLVIIILLNNCMSSHVPKNDTDCLRIVNAKIATELKREIGSEYDSLEKEINLIMKFYLKENGKADSIVVAKSNLTLLGVNEYKIINRLTTNRYKCLWDVYYTKELKPDYVAVIFNPKLKGAPK